MSHKYTANGVRALVPAFPWLDAAHIDYDTSSITQSDPEPGVPEASAGNTGALIPLTSGTQEATDYYVELTRGGGLDSSTSAAFGWRTTEETDLRGLDWPTVTRSIYNFGPTTGTGGDADAVALPDGSVVIVHQVVTVGGDTEVRCYRLDDAGAISGASAGSEVVLVSNDSGTGGVGALEELRPSLVYLRDSAELLCLVLTQGTDAPLLQAATYISTDKGATWSLNARNCLGAAAVTTARTYGRCALARVGDSLLLVTSYAFAGSYYYEQWVSHDLGVSFILVETDESDESEYSLCTDADNTVAYLFSRGVTATRAYVRRLASASQSISETLSVEWVLDATGSVDDAVSTSGVVMPDGRLYACGLDSNERVVRVCYSDDQGETWAGAGYSPIDTGGASLNLAKVSAAIYRGGVLILADLNDGWSTNHRLFGWAAGGWTTITMPELPSNIEHSRVARLGFGEGFSVSWLYAEDSVAYFPGALPSAGAWSAATTGTASQTLLPGVAASPYLLVAATTGTYTYSTAPTLDMLKGVMMDVACAVVSGGSVNTRVARIYGDDGTDYYILDLYVEDDKVRVWDDVDGADIIGPTAMDTSVPRVYRVAARADSVCLMYRELDSDVWTVEDPGTPTGTTGTVTAAIEFGLLDSDTASIRFYWVQYTCTCGDSFNENLEHGSFDLAGAPCSSAGFHTAGGLHIGFAGGIGRAGDSWTIPPNYAYGAQYATSWPTPSRIRKWKTLTDDATETLVWAPHGPVFLPPLIGGVLFGHYYAAYFEGKNSAGSWESLLLFNPSDEFNLDLEAAEISGTTGGVLKPADTGGSRYIARNELVGGFIKSDVANTGYPIIANTEGFFDTGNPRQCIITVSGWNGAEPSPASFTIYPPGTACTQTTDPTESYSAFRLRVLDGAVPGGKRSLKFHAGECVVLSPKYSDGRILSATPGNVSETAPNGQSFVAAPAPVVRSVKIAWTEGIDSQGLYRADGPDYVTLSDDPDAVAVGTQGAAHLNLMGLLEELEGAYRPVLYFASIPVNSEDGGYYTDRQSFLYGRLVSSVEIPTVIGDENSGEVVTISQIVIQEEV